MTADPRNDYLAAYRRSVESPSGVRDANLQAVLERAGHVEAAQGTPTRWAASALIIKFTTVALVTTGLGWGAVSVLSDDAPQPTTKAVASDQPALTPAAAPRPTQRSKASAVVPVAPPTAPALEPVSATPSAPRSRAVTPKPEPQAAADRLREELALLEGAQQHLRDGKIAQANQALREHARRFPQGTLSVERSAWSAIAACSGSGPQPQAAARSFVLTHEDTPLGAKVKVECGL